MGIDPKHVTAYHNLPDFMHMEDLISNKKIQSVAVIGGGLLGTELAYSMSQKQVLKEKSHLTKILPEYLSNWVTNRIRGEGVEIIEETTVKSANLDESGKVNFTTNSGK